jgi:hypothetical protein
MEEFKGGRGYGNSYFFNPFNFNGMKNHKVLPVVREKITILQDCGITPATGYSMNPTRGTLLFVLLELEEFCSRYPDYTFDIM